MARISLAKAVRVLTARIPRRNRRYCALCGHFVGDFIPFGRGTAGIPPLLRSIDIVGSDVDHFECPWCGSHDRERHLYLYMTKAGLLDRLPGSRVLHFAPERRLASVIASHYPACYVKCDLVVRDAGVMAADIMAIPFIENSFDFVIANHVLEHVNNDISALIEITRVLRPGGMAILQTPFSAKLQRTWFDPGIDSEESRLQAYGQSDHVRLYGKDIFQRFSSHGLKSSVSSHDDLLAEYLPQIYGVNQREPFFLFEKIGKTK